MINEAVYCSRLFYLMHVEGQFAPNAEPLKATRCMRVSTKKPMHYPLLPKPKTSTQLGLAFDEPDASLAATDLQADELPQPADKPLSTGGESVPIPETKIHARSVMLASDKLGVVAKLDLIEGSGRLSLQSITTRSAPLR